MGAFTTYYLKEWSQFKFLFLKKFTFALIWLITFDAMASTQILWIY